MQTLFKPQPANSIGLITNYRCNFQCKHCLYCSSPSIQENVETQTIKEVIDQINQVLGPVLLHVGGGEPLLHFDLIREILTYLRTTDIVVEYLETNGSMLITNTIPKLEALKSAGLAHLLLSISPFARS